MPTNLWSAAATLGQNCRSQGSAIGSLDLVIHHKATIVTFDDDFQKIAAVSKLQVTLLRRPSD